MKSTLILICICVFLATTNARDIAQGIGRMFQIGTENAQKCLDQMKATIEDLDLLEELISSDVGIEKMPIDEVSARRASCALVCCAQKQGTMVGAKLEMNKIFELVDKADVKEQMKADMRAAITYCSDQVKHITDECDLGRVFATCLVSTVQEKNRQNEAAAQP